MTSPTINITVEIIIKIPKTNLSVNNTPGIVTSNGNAVKGSNT